MLIAVVFGAWWFWPQMGNPYYSMDAYRLAAFLGLYSTDNPAFMFNVPAIFNFVLCLLPLLLFQAAIGMQFYSFFCSSSVYVFSRITDRSIWYRKQMLSILLTSVLYSAVYTLSALLVNLAAGKLLSVTNGLWAVLYQICTWAVWNFTMTMLVDILAVRIGSAAGFVSVAGTQMILAGLYLFLYDVADKDPAAVSLPARVNPLTVLMTGWQSCRFLDLKSNAALQNIYAFDSLIILLIICVLVYFAGRRFVINHDIIVSNAETLGV